MQIYYGTTHSEELQSINPLNLAALIEAIKPTVLSVRAGTGDELTVTNVSVVMRPNGVHLLLDVPEACLDDFEEE